MGDATAESNENKGGRGPCIFFLWQAAKAGQEERVQARSAPKHRPTKRSRSWPTPLYAQPLKRGWVWPAAGEEWQCPPAGG